MTPITKVALSGILFTFLLAGCQSVSNTGAPATEATPTAAQTVTPQPAAVDVYLFSNKESKGYRAVRLNDKQVIHISPQALVNRSHVTLIDVEKDGQNRIFIKLALNPQGAALLKSAPKNKGYATVIGGQLVSLTGVRQGSDFLFSVPNQQVAVSIIRAVVPQATGNSKK